MSEEQESTPEMKVVLLGESGVGKSSIIKQFTTHKFEPDIDPSISSKFTSKEMEIKEINKKIKFNLWDTAGQEKYRSLVKIFYKDARVIILVYNIESQTSFDNLKEYWYEEVKNNSLSNVILAVVGNKIDLYDRCQVNENEARQWADSINAIFQLTSAKSDSGIDLLFENIAKKFFDPNYNYKKSDEEAKLNYELKKKEQEEMKNKGDEEDGDDNLEIPKIENITLDAKDLEPDGKKKKMCC